ncbi:hypothetical protein [Methylobacterium sp. WL7]|uniref:hypothetical protein n=1 Tax=Methylobacterium sp. WL7 TaxID=2603900 RepID=UPI001FF04324|nr:hypothetical protein [Methylobacterium sp. WL7]
MGFSDPALTGGLERTGVTDTGRYVGDHEALDMVWRVAADLVLLAAIWPETYSYALTLALRTGLPVVAFDLGAQGERLSLYPNGHRLPYALVTDPAACNDRLLAIDISETGRLSRPIQAADYDDMMRDYYTPPARYGLREADPCSQFKGLSTTSPAAPILAKWIPR